MVGTQIQEYAILSLKELMEVLQLNYYNHIDMLCLYVDKHTDNVRKTGDMQDGNYVANCKEFISYVEPFIDHRKEIFSPYVNELSEKNMQGHDCSSCSGNCELQHSMRLLDYTNSLSHIRNIRDLMKPYFAEPVEAGGDVFEMLRKEMEMLTNALDELLIIEEDSLLSKLKDAQRSINARN